MIMLHTSSAHLKIRNLLSVLHTIGHLLDRNTQTDVLYLDLAKAFDFVDHTILLDKCRYYGVYVTGAVLDWFADYLNGRTQRVVVDVMASKWSYRSLLVCLREVF